MLTQKRTQRQHLHRLAFELTVTRECLTHCKRNSSVRREGKERRDRTAVFSEPLFEQRKEHLHQLVQTRVRSEKNHIKERTREEKEKQKERERGERKGMKRERERRKR
jgi:hypothetical protein